MRVVHVSTYDVSGGAARAAFRLHNALLEAGVDSTMFVRNKASGLATVVEYKPSGICDRIRSRVRFARLQSALNRYRFTRPRHLEAFDDDRSSHVGAIAQLPPCDIVHLHYVCGFIDHLSFLRGLRRHVPVVWTAHDMAPLTGGCHYDNGCSNYLHTCGKCPQLGSSSDSDLSRQVWNRKNAALSYVRSRLHFVAASRWIDNEIRRSSLTRNIPVSLIPHGLDTTVFAPKDRESCRRALGIDHSKRVVLFVSDSVDNPRKGMHLLLAAMRRLEDVDDLLLLSIGRNSPPPLGNVAVQHLGPVANDRFLAIAYSAADVFVIPSLQEMFGLTALEALACGTPAVGFDVGGIPDVIVDGKTGLLAAAGDADSLAASLRSMLVDEARRTAMGHAARAAVVDHFPMPHCAARHIDLYRSLAASAPTPPVAPRA